MMNQTVRLAGSVSPVTSCSFLHLGRRYSTGVILSCLLLGACAYAPQETAITQFSQTITTATNDENGLFDVATQRAADLQNLCIESASSVTIDESGQISPTGFRCQANANPTSLRAAVDVVMKAVQGYATALQSLASDAGATTFSTNIDELGKSITAFNTSVLTPLGVTGGLTTTQLNEVGAAVKDIGNALISFAISRDVQKAAQQMQSPLHSIATNLTAINVYWASIGVSAEESASIKAYVTVLWRNASFTSRQALQAMVARDFTPVSTDVVNKVNKALTDLAAANDKIAMAGPTLSIADIQNALHSANDAATALKALKGGGK